MPRKKAMKVTESPELNQNQIPEVTQTNQNQTISSADDTAEINLSPDYEKLEELKSELNETETEVEPEPKKKRGRKKKSETIQEVKIPEIDFSVLFDILIKRLPNPEPLTEIEKSLINNSANKVYHKYAGEFAYADEVNLGLVLVAVTYPRLKKSES